MSEHCVTLNWNRTSEDFQIKNYNRSHEWGFGNGNIVKASAAKDYMGDAEMVDPEQAFVASIAACHMLTFLAIASQKQFTIDSYKDDAAHHNCFIANSVSTKIRVES